ncbi:imidazolonepropionase [Enterococcus casseliflavus]|uniref:imidazolonepropionase n=1 Tax=Enterococcus casseliflavus TaxID=37734 RepID=UPI0035E187E5
MKADKILLHFSQVFCGIDKGHPLRGAEMNEAYILEDGYIAIEGAKIIDVGTGMPDLQLIDENTELIDCTGKTAVPGLIDCHTHLVYGGSREHEFAQKLKGVPYLEILAEGGGILNTVAATRKASFQELYQKSTQLLDKMALHGVTTIEAKSGYGLDWETEKRQLEVMQELHQKHPLDVVATFMAAHAIPADYKDDSNTFVEKIIQEMLPEVKQQQLAEFCDVFCEEKVFSAAQAYRLLSAAQSLGFAARIHADEIASIGGCQTAAELKAVSAEHLMVIRDSDIERLSRAQVIGNLLPGTTFSLMEDTYAPARKMLNYGMAITLATDSNPGSCPTANLQFIMQLGCLQMKLTPIEVFNAVTINAAYSIQRNETVGSLEAGKNADITIFDAKNIDFTMYFFATNLVSQVYKNGRLIVNGGNVLR